MPPVEQGDAPEKCEEKPALEEHHAETVDAPKNQRRTERPADECRLAAKGQRLHALKIVHR